MTLLKFKHSAVSINFLVNSVIIQAIKYLRIARIIFLYPLFLYSKQLRASRLQIHKHIFIKLADYKCT